MVSREEAAKQDIFPFPDESEVRGLALGPLVTKSPLVFGTQPDRVPLQPLSIRTGNKGRTTQSCLAPTSIL